MIAMVKIKKFDPLSVGKVLAVLYALMGIIMGGVFTLFALIGFGASAAYGADMPFFIPLFGIGAVLFLPIMYGVAGFVFGVITALLYNLVAAWVGGIEVETSK